MTTEYYNPTANPPQGGPLSSAQIRSEFLLLDSSFAKLPVLAGRTNQIVTVNAAGNALISSTSITIDASGDLNLIDNSKAIFGNSVDLQIYHSGVNSIIVNQTGELQITGDDVRLLSFTGGENLARFQLNGAATLYYDAVARFSTGLNANTNSGGLQIARDVEAYLDFQTPVGGSSTDRARFVWNGNTVSLTNIDTPASRLTYNLNGLFSVENVKAIDIKDFGFSATYKAILVGSEDANRLVSLGVDVSGNIGANFSVGPQVIFPTKGALIENTAGNDFAGAFSLNSSDQLVVGPETTAGVASGPLTIGTTFIKLGDGHIAYFGAGNDLQIYSDGANAFVNNKTGGLILSASVGGAVFVRDDANVKTSIYADPDANVNLYFNNALKLATNINGVTVTGSAFFATGNYVYLGDANEMAIIQADATTSVVRGNADLHLRGATVSLRNVANNKNYLVATEDGAVVLSYANVPRLSTAATGVDVSGSQLNIEPPAPGTGYPQFNSTAYGIYIGHFVARHAGGTQALPTATPDAQGMMHIGVRGHNGTAIKDTSNAIIQGVSDGLWSGTSNPVKWEFYTTPVGSTSALLRMTLRADGHLQMADNLGAYFGAGSDLRIYHNSTLNENYIEDRSTNGLRITTDAVAGMSIGTITGAESMIVAVPNSYVALFFNNTNVLQTKTGGVDVTGDLDATGDLSAGGTVAADGVVFPATQVASADANTLDDYEEGTWTPVLEFSTSTGTNTYDVQTGRYTKIGNVVHVDFLVDLATYTGANSGNARITGLPFNVGTNSHPSCAVFTNTANIVATGESGPGLSYIRLHNGGGAMTNTDFGALSEINASMTYFV